jgi:hypothetical protein
MSYLLFVPLTRAEHYALGPLREEEAVLQRPYHRPQAVSNWESLRMGDPYRNNDIERVEEDQYYKLALFLNVFSKEVTVERRKRVEHLASLVRWLCLPVNIPDTVSSDKQYHDMKKDDPWNALAMLNNLEHLEISAYWRQPHCVEPFKAPEKQMSNLKRLKLRGYIPAEFVQYVCANTSSITHLQLAVIDKPIGSSLIIDGRENPPPPVDPEDEDAESFEHSAQVAPRPLACLLPQTISNFQSLEDLYLCKPSEGPGIDEFDCQLDTSIVSDIKALDEWASLLRSARKTLTRITFDQRLVATENAPDGDNCASFVDEYCNGYGYQRFVENVLPVLLEDAEWPALKSIRLFGFEAEDAMSRKHSVKLVSKLQQRFGNGVQILNGAGRWMLMHDVSGEIQRGGDVFDCWVDWEDNYSSFSEASRDAE